MEAWYHFLNCMNGPQAEGHMASNIQRRKFLATLLGGAAVWPLAARAQQPKVPTIGALVIGNISPEEFWREFRQGLRDLGYIEGQNIRFEFRSAEGQIDRLPELAAELVRLKVDVIVTWFTPTAVAAKQATRDIPIVMAETGDPIGTGLVMSLPRPGGNVTGIASVTAELAGKSVQLIRDMLPSARRVTALANATDPFSKPFLEQIELGGTATGTAINPIRISNNEEFESAFAAMEKDRPDAIIVQPSLPTKRAADLALQRRVPAVSVPRWFADQGGLMSYSAIYADLFRKAAVYVDKILKGAQPADLPVEHDQLETSWLDDRSHGRTGTGSVQPRTRVDGVHQSGQATSAGGDDRNAFGGIVRRPDRRRLRAWLRGERAAGHWRAQGNARRDRRQAQQGDQRGPCRSQVEGAVCRPWCCSVSRFVLRLRQVHCHRNREVGQGDQVLRGQGGLMQPNVP